MEKFAIGLHKQLKYAQNVLSDRDGDLFEESLKNPLFPTEPSALEVFIHGVNSLFWAAQKLGYPDNDEQKFMLVIDSNSTVIECE